MQKELSNKEIEYHLWLASLQPGMKVASDNWGVRGRVIETVEAITPLHIITDRSRYRRVTGGEPKGGYEGRTVHYLVPYTPEIEKAELNRRLREWFIRLDVKSISHEQLVAMHQVYMRALPTPSVA